LFESFLIGFPACFYFICCCICLLFSLMFFIICVFVPIFLYQTIFPGATLVEKCTARKNWPYMISKFDAAFPLQYKQLKKMIVEFIPFWCLQWDAVYLTHVAINNPKQRAELRQSWYPMNMQIYKLNIHMYKLNMYGGFLLHSCVGLFYPFCKLCNKTSDE
jgi:hypothetical protein